MYQQIPLNDIAVIDRLRPVDLDWAQALASSFLSKGQDTAILVRPNPDGGFILVAGAHRLEAARIAGLDAIRADVREMSVLEARLSEIDENLMRVELTAVDRAIFLSQRKKVWDEMYPETKQGGDRKSQKALGKIKRTDCPFELTPTFTKEVADKTGLSARTVRRAIELTNILSPDIISSLRHTVLADNAAQLKALAREKPEDQARIIAAILDGHARNVAGARQATGLVPVSEVNPHEIQSSKLLALWNRASPKARRIFLAAINEAEDSDTRQVA